MNGISNRDGPGPQPDPFIELLKAINKDSVGAFRGERKVQQGASIEGTAQAYRQMRLAAQTLALRAQKIGRTPILLQVGEDLSEIAELKLFERRRADLDGLLDKAIKQAKDALAAPPLGAGIVDSALAVAAIPGLLAIAAQLLRTDIAETHNAVTIDDRTLVAAVERACRTMKDGVRALTPTEIALLPPPEDGVRTKMEALEKKADELRALVVDLTPAAVVPGQPSAPPPSAERQRARAQGDAVMKVVDAFLQGFPAVAGRIYRADAMRHELGEKGAVLGLRMLAAAGGTRVWTNGWGATKRHVATGGVIVAFAFLDRDGAVLDDTADIECSGLIEEKGFEDIAD